VEGTRALGEFEAQAFFNSAPHHINGSHFGHSKRRVALELP
jgi:hypothetical protein